MKTHQFQPFLRLSALLVINSLLLLSIQAQLTQEFIDNRPLKSFGVSKTSQKLEIDLDYKRAFDITIKSFNGQAGNTGFCHATPSKIAVKMDWAGRFPSDGIQHSYDNIVNYKGYYFILDSITFTMFATPDFTNHAKYVTIESDFKNEVNDNDFEIPFMVVDEVFGILFIVTEKKLYSYDLNHFISDVKNPKKIQPLDTAALGDYYKGYTSIFNVVHTRECLFVAADKIVDVFITDKHGSIKPKIRFDAAFFKVDKIDIVDIAVHGNYAFVLDVLAGVFIVDLTQALTVNKDGFKYLPNLRQITASKAEYIEVVGASLYLIFATTKNHYVEEYILIGTPEILNIVPNRKINTMQNVRDTYSDRNFLYFLTGFFNIAVRHSVPGKYITPNNEIYLSEYWALLGIKAMTSSLSKKNSTSHVVAIQREFITSYNFDETDPSLYCDIQNIAPGTYTFEIQALQSYCPLKGKNSNLASWDSVCVIHETIQIVVADDASYIGNVSSYSNMVFLLMIGVGISTFLVLLCLCLCGKYRTQFRKLEDQIKFHRIEEDSTGRNAIKRKGEMDFSGSPSARSDRDMEPDKINIQAELEKDEAREKKKAGNTGNTGNPRRKRNEAKVNAEFGDIKPLDVDAIYGTPKGGNDSF